MMERQPLDPIYNQMDEACQYEVNAYITRVFGWMFLGLLVTTITTIAIIFGMSTSPDFANLIYTIQNLVIIVFIAQLILVFSISRRVEKMNPTTAKIMYLVYAMTNGLTIGFVAVMLAFHFMDGLYTLAVAFGVTTVSFGIMAVYGLTTKKDLTGFSSLFRMALIGLILAIIANIFFGSDMLDLLIIVGGLILFLGLVAADTNKIKNHFAHYALNSEGGVNSAIASNLAIVGALMLYLDFINIFMFILRLMMRRR